MTFHCGYTVVHTWMVDHGPGKPYEPHMKEHGLYLLDEPEPCSGKRYFLAIDPSVSRSYITDEEARQYMNK